MPPRSTCRSINRKLDQRSVLFSERKVRLTLRTIPVTGRSFHHLKLQEKELNDAFDQVRRRMDQASLYSSSQNV